MSVFGTFLEESYTLNESKLYDIKSVCNNVENGELVCKNWNKIKKIIVDEFSKYYINKCKEKITKKEISDNLIVKNLEFKSVTPKNDWYVFSAYVDLSKDLLKKITDDHVPSVTIYVKKNSVKCEIYFDG